MFPKHAGLVALGAYFLLSSIRVLFTIGRNSEFPYFRVAFVLMTVFNAVFPVLFPVAAFLLLRLRKAGDFVHAITSALLIGYGVVNRVLWLAGRGIGNSTAAATGIGNMGIAPFAVLFVVPYVYPIASSLALLVASWKLAHTLSTPPCHDSPSTFLE
jgi:hypothetical protein